MAAASPASSPASDDLRNAKSLDWDEFFTGVADWLTLACYGIFILLLGWDVWRAFKKRATWLPGNAFSLTGVTVQIIVWWTSVSRITNECKKDVDVYELLVYHQIVLSGKVALCVFIGYLLPKMAAPSVRTFLALGISICAQLASELHTIEIKHGELGIYFDETRVSFESWRTWTRIANSIVFICIIILVLISVCIILAIKTLQGLLRQRICPTFSIAHQENALQISNERTSTSVSWNEFEDEVVRSWLVARACQADYVISRSVLSSAVGIVVTVCVIISILSNTYRNEYLYKPLYLRDYAILLLLFGFILIGWIIICLRWFTAQLYFRSYKQSWRRCLCLEDFWTRNTVELIQMCELKRDRQRFPKMHSLLTKMFTKVKLHKLIYLLLWLQQSVVIFSKLCGLLSHVILGKYVYWLRKHIRNGHAVEQNKKKYARTLKLLCVSGEDPSDLWEANEMSFNKVKLLMHEGCENGKSTEKSNSFFCQYSVQWTKDGRQLLNMLQEKEISSVKEYFPSVEKKCVRITTVSLITIFIRLHKAKSDKLGKALSACREVWDLLTFADECDIDLQANEISLFEDLNKDKDQVYMAAEREFYKLEKEYGKLDASSEGHAKHIQEARRTLEEIASECDSLLKRENLLGGEEERDHRNLSDSKDWVKIAPTYNLYKLCKVMLDEDIEDFVAWTEDALKNVIACCVSRLPDMLLKQCWVWAQEFEEDKIWEAADLTGKCRGITEAWEPKLELARTTTKQPSGGPCSRFEFFH